MEKIPVYNFLLEDMDIFDSVLPTINKTITKYGCDELKNKLKYISTTSLPTLISIVAYFNKNDEYRNKIEDDLNFIKQKENIIDNWLYLSCDKDLCFTGSYEYANNAYSLNITNTMKFSTIVITIIFYFIMYYFLKYAGVEVDPVDYIKSIGTGYYTMASFILSVFIGNKTAIDLLAKGLTFLYIAYQFYLIYETIIGCINHYTKCDNFKKEYYQIISVLKHAKNIWKNDLTKDLYFSEEELLSIQKSFKNLDKHFTYDNSLGHIIIEKIYYDEYLDDFKNILMYIGTVDMLISNSKLLNIGYSSPNVDESYENPYISLTNLWNPLLDFESQVKNTVHMGLTTNKTMIITGPNKAGKSTFLRSFILAIYLAQSLGITCAESLYFTPFSNIFTYLNVPDHIGKDSLFEAELERCYEYYKVAMESDKNNKILGFIDEMFTGTNYAEGMAGSYAIIKKISEITHTMTIVTTHFHEICCIPNVNYCKFIANVSETSDKGVSKYKFPYKIENGVSNQCIALDLLDERGYGNEIITYAKNKLNDVIKHQS